MATTSLSIPKRPVPFIALWAITLFAALLLAVFLHEDGHGLGAKIDGVHVSTGFNKVGMPGRTPDDPDFRTGMPENVFWGGLLGPMTSWALVIVFTVWLYRFKGSGWGALLVGAFAVANGLMRGMPMLMFLLKALSGRLVSEDEVRWSVWYVANVCKPELASRDLDLLEKTQPGLFFSDPFFWIPALFSLAISLVCLVLAYRRLYRLWSGTLRHWTAHWLFGLAMLPVWFVSVPVWNVLDRLIRINW